MRKRILLLLPLALLFCLTAKAQDAIYFTNPSFEDIPRNSIPPTGWIDCGWKTESPPDVHPSGSFNVYRESAHGLTYLGLVTRDNETYERVSQKLSSPLQAGKCYEFNMLLARSKFYLSQSQLTGQDAQFTTPTVLRVYGGYGLCDRAQLLDETDPVVHTDWRQYSFKLEPKGNYAYIVFEVYYETPVLFPYNGNMLLDHASSIKSIPCDQDVPDRPQDIDEPLMDPVIADNSTPDDDRKQPKPPVSTPQPTPTPEPPTVPEPEPKVVQKSDKEIAGVKRSELRKGLEIQLENVFFEADSSRIRKESTEALNEVYDFLQTYDDLVIEVGGHTNSYPPDAYCDRLSTARAKAVVDFLASKGIPKSRLQYKGYGKRKPIATNETKAGREKNQRVEIKILEMGGG
jgi:outer membrane protein OmpA-like peptidoglycan-associated protein